MAERMEFQNKVAVVTGGATGIGRATTLALLRGGATVVVAGHRREELDQLLVTTESYRDRLSTFLVDVADDDQVAEMYASFSQRHDRLDILVNCAGVFAAGSIEQISSAEWRRCFEVNVNGIWRSSKAAIPIMRKGGGGSIVNVASVAAQCARRGMAAYAATKGAITSLTHAMAIDHAEERIRVNAVSPGTIDTPFLRGAWSHLSPLEADAQLQAIAASQPLGRLGTAEDIAHVIAFLCSEQAAFVTGADWVVDGGLLARLGVPLPHVRH